MALPTLVQKVSLDPSGFRAGVGDVVGQFGVMGNASDGAGAKMAAFGKLAVASMALGVGAAVGLGVALFKVGETFDEAFDKIRVGTGETGKNLEGLTDSMKNVFASVPASAEQAADAITKLHVGLGLTGKPLEELASQMINLSRVTGTDLNANLETTTQLFNNWGISAEDQQGKIDLLFRATQKSGIGFAELSGTMTSSGPILRSLGFSFEETTGLIGALHKAGVDSGPAMMAMGKSIAAAVKEGKAAPEAFRETIDSIKNMDEQAAQAKAIEAFGTRAGPKLAALIREGRFSYEEMTKAISNGSDTVNKASEDTYDFAEQWHLFKNRILVGLEPLASKVFRGVGDAMTVLGPIIADLFTGFAKFIDLVADALSGNFKPLQEALGLSDGAVATIKDVLSGLKEAFSETFGFIKGLFSGGGGDGGDKELTGFAKSFAKLRDSIRGYIGEIGDAVGKVFDAIDWKAIGQTIASVWEDLKPVLQGFLETLSSTMDAVTNIVRVVVAIVTELWSHFGDDVLGYVTRAFDAIATTIRGVLEVIRGVMDVITGVLTGDWGKAWDGIKEIFGGVWTAMEGILKAVWNNIETVLGTIVEVLQTVFGPAIDAVKPLFETAWKAAQEAVSIAWGIIRPIFDTMKDSVGLVGDAFNLYKDTVTGALDIVVGAVTGMWDKVSGPLNDLATLVRDTLGGAWGVMKDAAVTAWDGVAGAIKGAMGSIGAIVGGFLDVVGDVAHAIPGLDGLGGTLHGARDKVRGWASLAEGGQVPMVARNTPFVTSGIAAIVGEGRPAYPEYVIPTDPQHRKRAQGLYSSLGRDLGVGGGGLPATYARGGMLDGIPHYDIGGIIGAVGDVGKGILDAPGWLLDKARQALSGAAGWIKDRWDDAFSMIRDIAAGAVEKMWPTLEHPDNFAGMPAAGINATRDGAIGMIKGKSNEWSAKLDEEFAKDLADEVKKRKAASTGGATYGPGGGGNVFARVAPLITAAGGIPAFQPGGDIASMYREGAGLHGDAGNPAVDIGDARLGTGFLNRLYPMIAAAGPWRELLWQVAGHYDHIHVANRGAIFDKGGTLAPGVNVVRNMTGAKEPLVAIDRFSMLVERLARVLETGPAGGGVNVTIERLVVNGADDPNATQAAVKRGLLDGAGQLSRVGIQRMVRT